MNIELTLRLGYKIAFFYKYYKCMKVLERFELS